MGNDRKYTPGPWLKADDDKTFIYALNKKGYNRFWFKLQAITNKEHEASQEELEANADLIAAAPELLEALEEALQWHLGDKWRFSKYQEEREAWNRRHIKLQSLVTKAKGEG